MNVTEAITQRRTIRKFSQQPLDSQMLKKYVDAARVAPSAANLQPLKYVTVTNGEMLDNVFSTLKWAGYLKGEYTPKENERPTGYIVVCVDSNISHANYDIDVGAAVEHMILSALEDEVGACWLGSVERPRLKRLLGLSANLEISCVVALGYPLESPQAVQMDGQDVKYYLDGDVLKVPKRTIDEILILQI